MDGFHVLSRRAIEQELASVARRWNALPGSMESFAAWAWVVASVCDTFASENPGACKELLEAETQALARVVEERHRLVPGETPPELKQKEAFLGFLTHAVDQAPQAAA
jgi:hypothetical protein